MEICMGKPRRKVALAPAIATFAICGFTNPGSTAIIIAIRRAFAFGSRRKITKVTLQAFISSCFVPLLTGSIAGLLSIKDEMLKDFETKALLSSLNLQAYWKFCKQIKLNAALSFQNSGKHFKQKAETVK
jgi:Na+ dependent nucleoside transporter C-terminus